MPSRFWAYCSTCGKYYLSDLKDATFIKGCMIVKVPCGHTGTFKCYYWG